MKFSDPPETADVLALDNGERIGGTCSNDPVIEGQYCLTPEFSLLLK